MRRSWRRFRSRFDELRGTPILDYRSSRALTAEGADFRFFGGFESVTDGKTLWVRSEGLTIPVELFGAHIFLLPAIEEEKAQEEVFDLEGAEPEKIRWDRVAALSEGTKVFIGGRAMPDAGRAGFKSTGEDPLLIILYDGDERSMLARTVRAGRHRNEYWNKTTPYALALGVFSEVIVALWFAPRPALRTASSAAIFAAFGPLFPLFPPGMLLTNVYVRLWKKARAFRALRDLVRLPLRHLGDGATDTVLPDGEHYGRRNIGDGRQRIALEAIPILPPGTHADEASSWFCFGIVSDEDGPNAIPKRPKDPTAVYAAMPGTPEELARSFSARAKLMEIAASAALMAALFVNAAFILIMIGIIR